MKHRTRLAAALCTAAMTMLMAGCSSELFNHEGVEELYMSSTVAFRVVDGAPGTRGQVIDSVHKLADFRADAYLHRGGTVTPYFTNERQYDANAQGVFHADHGGLWPNEAGDKMGFVAVAPYSVATNLNISQQGDFSYTVPDNVVDQCDLMQAIATNVECPPPGQTEREPVPVTFKHLLTQVQFVFGANPENYWRELTVHSVKIENVATSGTWNASSGTWQVTDAPTHSYEIIANDSPLDSGSGRRPYANTEVPIWNKDYTMFLMPQTLPTDARVAIDMSYLVSKVANGHTERKTYYIYLDGKKLLPGHTVFVEVNSNYAYDCRVVNLDGSDVELRPLSGNAQDITLKALVNQGAGSMMVHVLPECRGFAQVSSSSDPTPADSCAAGEYFTVHIAANTSDDDRFIRLALRPGHNSSAYNTDHFVVLKQRGRHSYGDFIDDPGYVDIQLPWGFNWTAPLNVSFHYDSPFGIMFDYDQRISEWIHGWATKGSDNITINYADLRDLVLTPNSTSDGLANCQAINNYCHFLRPSGVLYFLLNFGSSDEERLNGVASDRGSIINALAPYDQNVFVEVLRRNRTGATGGQPGTEFVANSDIKHYLPAIEQLETIAQSGSSALEAGRTYWSSTVDTDRQPIALQINADGSFTRTKPGIGAQAYVHAVLSTH